MKKLLSVLMVISVVLLLLPTSFAAAQIGDPAFADPDYTEIKQMLLDLGMGAYFVERMTDEQLERIANAQGISYMTQQIPIDGGAASPNAIPPIDGPILPEEPEDDLDTYSEFATDDYMTMYLLVIKLTPYNYLMSIDIEWDQMPGHYLTDSLGICASKLDVVRSTRSGWFDYCLSYDNGTTRMFSYDFPETSFELLGVSGGWNGSLVLFDLYDIIVPNLFYDRDLTEMYAHYEFEMTSGSTPELGAINVTATYDHMVEEFNFDASLSVGAGGIGFSVTPSLIEKFHRRSVSLPEPINYIPT